MNLQLVTLNFKSSGIDCNNINHPRLNALLNYFMNVRKYFKDSVFFSGQDVLNGIPLTFSLHDGISEDLPVGVFSTKKRFKKAICFPNLYAMRNFDGKLHINENLNEWENKIEKAIFAGTDTGNPDLDLNLRFQYSKYAHATSKKFFESYITQWLQTKRPDDFQLYSSPYISISNQKKYKYIVSIDSNACAWDRVPWILASNSLLFKVETEMVDWFYDKMQPFIHYVPINKPEEVDKMVQHFNEHKEEALAIIRNAHELVKEHLFFEKHLEYSCEQLIKNIDFLKSKQNIIKPQISPELRPRSLENIIHERKEIPINYSNKIILNTYGDTKDFIINYYKQFKEESFIQEPINEKYITNYNPGIGDMLLLCVVPKIRPDIKISGNHYLPQLLKFNPYFKPEMLLPIRRGFFIEDGKVIGGNWGKGHVIQRVYRMLGRKPELKPKSVLFVNSNIKSIIKTKSIKIGFHLESKSSDRRLDKKTIDIVNQFVNKNSDRYYFVEFGFNSYIHDSINFTGKSLEESICELNDLDYLICCNSGFMNLATALNIRTITLLPSAFYPQQGIVLPKLHSCSENRQLQWLYPQNVHLHEVATDANPLVPQISVDNIERAINGEIYPFWKEDFLDLIYER